MVAPTLWYRVALIFCCFPFICQAQCINRTELLALFDSCLTQPYSKQVSTISSILKTWQNCHYLQDSSYVNLNLELAKAMFRDGNTQAAITQIEHILPIYNKPVAYLKPEDQVKAYYRLGFYWRERNQFNNVILASKKAIKLGERLPASRWTSFAYNTLAYANYSMGEYQKAIEYAKKGMAQALIVHDDVAYLEAQVENIKGLIALGEYEKARKNLATSIALAQKSDQYSLATLLMYKANLEIANRNIQAALASCKEALAINLLLNYKPAIINSQIIIGFLLYQLKQYGEALTYYREAYKQATDPFVKLRILDNIAAVYWQKKAYPTALKYYQDGLTVLPFGFTNRQITALPKADMIRVASQKEFLLTLIQDKADTWLDYAKATKDRQRLQHALETYTVADQMIDFMRWEHSGQQSKLYWRQKTRGMYERALETCFLLNDTEQAFRFLEKSRAVMLADKLNELGARQQLAPQLVAQEQKLRQAVESQQQKLAGLSPDSAAYLRVRSALLTKQDSLDTFLKELEAYNPAYYHYKYDNTTPTLAQTQQFLRKNQSALITYFVGDSALYVMSITPDKLLLRKQSISQYNRSIEPFAQLLSNPDAMSRRANVQRFLTSSNQLYRQLLAPFSLPQGRVIVSPDGYFIPFDALSRSDKQPDYALNEYAFSYAYSANLLLREHPHEQYSATHKASFLGVAPVDFAPKLNQVMLSGSDDALKSIADHFTAPKLLTHQLATRAAFQREVVNYPVVLLFTHAQADSTDQEPTLYFADSTLRLSELGNGALPEAQLVALAACKTGIGANQQGEGVFSLARGFSALGVPSVLTTLWSVQNQATYQLTNLFYQYLDEGLPKDLALQRAKQEWLKTTEGINQLPNYWAGLIIVGDSTPLLRINFGLWIIAAIGICFAGLSLWYYRWKRRPKLIAAVDKQT